MEIPGYAYDAKDFVSVLLMKFYPERTDRESRVIRAFLLNHIYDYDSLEFSRRVGTPIEVNPEHAPATQKTAVFSSLKRIDILARRGPQPTIIEVKHRVTPSALGQILTYRQLLREERPDDEEPRLLVIGEFSDKDTIRALNAEGVDVKLYPQDDAGGLPAGSGV